MTILIHDILKVECKSFHVLLFRYTKNIIYDNIKFDKKLDSFL